MRGALRSRALAALLGTILALGGLAAAIPRVATAADEELRGSREDLRETRERIRARAQRMRVQQRGLNALPTEIARNGATAIEASAPLSAPPRAPAARDRARGAPGQYGRAARGRIRVNGRKLEEFVPSPADPPVRGM